MSEESGVSGVKRRYYCKICYKELGRGERCFNHPCVRNIIIREVEPEAPIIKPTAALCTENPQLPKLPTEN